MSDSSEQPQPIDVASLPLKKKLKKRGPKPVRVSLPPIMATAPEPTAEQRQIVAQPATDIATTSYSQLTAEHIAIIEQALETGLTIPKACTLAGVSASSYENWRNANPALYERFRLVEIKAERKTVQELKDNAYAGNRCWTAFAWLLERRYGWHLKTETKTTTDVNLTISRNLMATLGNAGDIHHKAKPTLQTVDVEAKELDVR